jgi:NADPH:quinone reductase
MDSFKKLLKNKMKTKQIQLKSRPQGNPKISDFNTTEVELPAIKDKEVLLKGLYYSVDPYMRGRMNDSKSYIAAFNINAPIEGAVVAEVIESKTEKYNIGDTVVGMLPWQENMVHHEEGLQKIDKNATHKSYYLSVLGMPGLTAYFGLLHICKPIKGETVVVSGAAGAVGIVVGQLAKISGCKVIGIAGSDEKATLLKNDFGYDAVINYKTTKDIKTAIANACPNGVDVYYDNVGGEISDAVIANINFNARIALCGQISLYNSTETPMGPRLQPMLLTKSVLMQGFIIGNFKAHFAEGTKQLMQWLNEGKLKYTETIEKGFDNLPKAFIGLFNGDNTGKMIVEA